MAKSFDVTDLSEQDVDHIVLALDHWIGSQPNGVPQDVVDLMLRFDNLTEPVVNERILQHADNIIRVDFNH